MRARWVRRVGLCGLLFTLFLSTLAFARPGGGQGFSGSSSRSSGSSRSSSSSSRSSYSGGGGGVTVYSSGGGDGSLGGSIASLVLFIVIALVVNYAKQKAQGSGWSAGHSGIGDTPPPPPPPVNQSRKELERLRAFDPAFSLVVFDDFVSALYSEILLARGQGQLGKFSAYLSPAAAQWLERRPLDGLTHALVGGVSLAAARGINAPPPAPGTPDSARVTVEVVFESNLSRRDAQTGKEQALYVRERWVLSRARSAKSRTPDKARVFACPNCTAPLTEIFGGKCRHCGQNVASGAFDWVVDSIFVEATEQRGPMLTGNTEEQGNNLPTVVDRDAHAAFATLQQKDPALAWNPMTARMNLIFQTFQTAWAARDLASMRPYLSDALFTVQNYWVSEYLRQGLRNVTENATLHNIELARVTTDAFFDAVTVRIWASSLDYTLSDRDGKLVSGSRSKVRKYTEYWTFIRSSRAKGPPRTDPNCPRCGAPLDVNMGGQCKYCQSKVTSGDFDWVLSRIEQDEVYTG